MRVKLLQDVGRTGGAVSVTVRRGRLPIFWEKGAVMEMSDASAAKYIKQGVAERYDGPAAKHAD